jgi:hypothetical protein
MWVIQSPMQRNQQLNRLAGFKIVKPTVFCGIFPTDDTDVNDLRDSLEKLKLNDTSFSFEPENSVALGIWLSLWIPGHASHGNYPRATWNVNLRSVSSAPRTNRRIQSL